MLLPRRTLERIADGTVSLAFRRWRRPTVRTGGRLRTAVGELAIERVHVVDPSSITEEDARRAGHPSRDHLLERLARRPDGDVYRVELRLAGPDPRVALRARARLGAAERGELRERLAGLDRRSRHGPWTHATLRLIRDHPGVLAADLAASVGRDTVPFKRDVRKLKELGLTESLSPGYRLSPRGRAIARTVLDDRT